MVILLAKITVNENESVESALRRFKRKCQKEGIISEMKKRQNFEKPSERKKKEKIEAIKRDARRARKQQRKNR